MRYFNTFCFLLIGLFLSAQNNYSYHIPGFPETFNSNVELVDINTYNLSGSVGTQGNLSAYLAQHNNGTVNWATVIKGQAGEVMISDQVLLPNGNTAVTGVSGDVNQGYDPFIAIFDTNGNLLNAIGYTGFQFPFSATHQIVYDEANEQLIVCGSNRVQDPFQFTYCPDQTAFVLSVKAGSLSTVLWCSTMDSGPGVANNDFDLAENLLVLSEGVFVTGSTNDIGSGDQLVMYALLKSTSGQSLYANGVRLGGASFGAGADAIIQSPNENNILVMANTDVGLSFFCVDTNSGNVQSSFSDNTTLPTTGTMFGYELVDNSENGDFGLLTVAGYIIDPGSTSVMRPFFYELESGECFLAPTNEGYYFLNNNTTMPSRYYGAIGGIEYINTPNMAIKDNNSIVMLGYDDNGFAVNHFDYANQYQTACLETLTPVLNSIPNFVGFTANFLNNSVTVKNAKLKAAQTNDPIVITCDSNIDCPIACPVTVTPLQCIDFNVSAGNCIPAAYSPQYRWDIPSLNIFNQTGQTITVQDLGGGHPYTLWIDYTNADGTPVTCMYQNELVIPAFDCSQLQVNVTTDYLHNMTYKTSVTVSPSCAGMNISIAPKLASSNCYANPTQVTNNTLTWDATNCGAGLYEITVEVALSAHSSIEYCYFMESVGVQNCSIEAPEIISQQRTGNFFATCGFGDNVAIEYFPSQIDVCYQYQWVLSPAPGCVPIAPAPVCPSVVVNGPVYTHCDENNPLDLTRLSIRITDTCTGCVYFYPSVAAMMVDGGGLEALQSSDSNVTRIETSIGEIEKGDRQEPSFTFSLSPNPTKGIVQVSVPITNSVLSSTMIHVYNNQGVLVKEKNLEEGRSNISINLSEQPSGVYYIRYSNPTGSGVKPLVISH